MPVVWLMAQGGGQGGHRQRPALIMRGGRVRRQPGVGCQRRDS